jgi:hypothetical protein
VHYKFILKKKNTIPPFADLVRKIRTSNLNKKKMLSVNQRIPRRTGGSLQPVLPLVCESIPSSEEERSQYISFFRGKEYAASSTLLTTKGNPKSSQTEMDYTRESAGVTRLDGSADAVQEDPHSLEDGKINEGEHCLAMTNQSSTTVTSTRTIETTPTNLPHSFHQWTESDLTPNPVVYPTNTASSTVPPFSDSSRKTANRRDPAKPRK